MKLLLYWNWSWRNSLGKCFKYLTQSFPLVFYIVCNEVMQHFRERRISKSVTSCPLPSSYLYREEMKDECYMTGPPLVWLSSVFLQDDLFWRPVKMSQFHSHDNQNRLSPGPSVPPGQVQRSFGPSHGSGELMTDHFESCCSAVK